jgi:competence ComEA-like helix-hairpin-helix protein
MMKNAETYFKVHLLLNSAVKSVARVLFACFISWLLVPPSEALAQERDSIQTRVELDLERAIEEIDPEESGLDTEELLEFLQNLAANPVNINRATVDELLLIPGLNLRLAENIVQARSRTPFTKVEDLLDVSGIGPATLGRIRPYMRVGSGLELGRDLYLNPRFWTTNSRFEGFSRYQRVVQEQNGYIRPDSSGFLGSPVKYYQRYRYTSNYLSLNLTQEKDAGEELAGISDFDYNSWHIAVQDVGNLQSIIVGDYSVSVGQGLLLWNGGAFGKGRDVIRGVSKNERGVRPFTSAREGSGFRGIAATYGNHLQVTGFYSNRSRTASLNGDGTVNFPTESGFHRTISEIDRKNSLNQTTFGGRIRARIPYGFVGVTGFFNRFDQPVAAGSQPYQIYNFSGTDLSGYAADYRLLIGPAIAFGEFATTDNGGYGLLTGTEFELSANSDVILSYRYYDKALQSIFGAGFGEQSGDPGNEEGFYIGFEHDLNEQISISAYLDQFRFPAPRFQTSQPTSGYDWLGYIEYTPMRELSLYALIRFQTKEEEYDSIDDFGREIRLLDDNKRTGARIQAEYQVHPNVRLRTRFDMARSRDTIEDETWGYLVFQDVRLTPRPYLKIDARITMFDTDDFSSRLYQFENDLLYVLSNTVLFDQGQRMYIVVNYEPAEWLQLSLKAATTVYEDQNIISSGLNQINGNRRSDVGIQARMRF